MRIDSSQDEQKAANAPDGDHAMRDAQVSPALNDNMQIDQEGAGGRFAMQVLSQS